MDSKIETYFLFVTGERKTLLLCNKKKSPYTKPETVPISKDEARRSIFIQFYNFLIPLLCQYSLIIDEHPVMTTRP